MARACSLGIEPRRRHEIRPSVGVLSKAKGLTQAELADALGKPQSFVAKYENGERRIDVVEFVDITAALGVSTAGLLARIEPLVPRPR
ncbi:helix-turn-helix domain-containing protein [Sphingomonas sp.]|uniref:helix-turn-helix domain-containing protein n=1 Tax=Sphingomonas sp. TaxID=28214 RepID=UPI003FA7C4FD